MAAGSNELSALMKLELEPDAELKIQAEEQNRAIMDHKIMVLSSVYCIIKCALGSTDRRHPA